MTVDYRSMKKGPPRRLDPKKDAKDDALKIGSWWKADDAQRADAVLRVAEALKEQQTERYQMNLMHARLFGNNDLSSFGGRTYTSALVQNSQTRIAINIVASAIDTLAAKIAKSRPRPSFQTAGGSWSIQQKAQRLNSFMEGVFYEAKVYTVTILQFLCACVFGTGAVKIFLNDANRLELENAFIDELYVDDADGKYGKPRQLFQRKMISKDVLLEAYGDTKERIEAINGAMAPEDCASELGYSDQVEVWEAWHLKSGHKATDGKHVIAIRGCELHCEEWKHDFFPFAFLRFKKRILGFWGMGVAEILTGIQVSINRTIRSIDEQIRRKGKGRIFVQKGSKVLPSHLTNGIADIVEYLGLPPQVDNANAVSAEEFMYLKDLVQQGFQEVGVSQLSAGMKKPSGLDAQVAIREFTDIESERFAPLSQDWDQNFLNIAEICICLVREDAGKGYKVRLPNKRYIVDIDWDDIDLKKDDFIMQMFPVSSLPAHPGARYQKVKEMFQDGVIDLATFKKLMDFPDIKAESDLGNAAMDDVACVIGYILDDAKPHFEPPDQYQNLELLISMATASLLYAKHHGAEEERLEMLRQLIDEAAELLIPPPMPGMDPAAAGGMPVDPAMAAAGAPAGAPPMSQSQTMINPVQPAVAPLLAS